MIEQLSTDNLYFFTNSPVNFYFSNYMKNKDLKKRLGHRENDLGIYELYDTVSGLVVMSSSDSLENYLRDI